VDIDMSEQWLAERTLAFDSSGIRRVFDLAAQMEDPINLSIGQPDFDVPEEVREAFVDAVVAANVKFSSVPAPAADSFWHCCR
jgi:aspartate aminotransferase/aminotransferase